MSTETQLRLIGERMVDALADIATPQAADLRAELADPAWVTWDRLAEVSGLSGIPAQAFFEDVNA